MLRELVTLNPRRASVHSNPRRKKRAHRAKYYRNPRLLSGAIATFKASVPALVGDASAVGVDYLYDLALNKLVPEDWRPKLTGTLPRAIARAVVAYGASFGLGKAFGKTFGDQVFGGSLAVIGYDAAKSFTGQLGYYDGDLAAYERVGYGSALPFIDRRDAAVGAYVRDSDAFAGLMPVTR